MSQRVHLIEITLPGGNVTMASSLPQAGQRISPRAADALVVFTGCSRIAAPSRLWTMSFVGIAAWVSCIDMGAGDCLLYLTGESALASLRIIW